jgi:3-dehydroquinate synthase
MLRGERPVNAIDVEVPLARPYRVLIGPGVLGRVESAIAGSCALLVDSGLPDEHLARLGVIARLPRVALPGGEAAKELRVLESTLQALASHGLDRNSTLLVLGGGAALDLGGLAASLYMRGIDAVYCPTTLLAQVDASVGGKTAVNLPAGKNLAGTFHQPRAVFADTSALSTLPSEHFRAGLGEMVKHAVIEGERCFAGLEQRAKALIARDPEALCESVAESVRVKAKIVASDEREAGPRKQLNLGHTFAHAIEHEAGYGRVSHGVAVAVGVVLALETARDCGLLSDASLLDRTRTLLRALGLPASLDELRRTSGAKLAPEALLAAMRLDKKSRAGRPRFVLPKALGDVRVDVDADASRCLS